MQCAESRNSEGLKEASGMRLLLQVSVAQGEAPSASEAQDNAYTSSWWAAVRVTIQLHHSTRQGIPVSIARLRPSAACFHGYC